MGNLGQTPSQTVGPYYSMRLGDQNILPTSAGERIRIEGRVIDGDGANLEDALIEIWQANASGRYHHRADNRDDVALQEGFTGFGRAGTDFSTGLFWFETVKPGRVPDPEGELQAPHISVVVQGRGMLNPSFTRIYFSDEADANEADLVLRMVPAARRSTLIARLVDGSEPKVYRFDIKFQGEDETVFFDY
ncbi:MAG: protocatechuate 3,4-dioxygenase subunit alpha [Acidimicrobiia bacterium]